MKKFVSICIATAVILSMMTLAPFSSSAAGPAKLIDFYEEYLYDEHPAGGENEVSVSWKDHAMHITANTEGSEKGDPYFTIAASGGFSADDNPYMVIKLKNLSECPIFEMHFGTDLYSIAGNTVVHFDMTTKDSDYKTYVVNIPEKNLATAYPLNGPDGIAQQDGSDSTPIAELDESTWQGEVTSIRIDAMYMRGSGGHVPDGSEMYIEYVAFFATEAEANAYAASGPDRSGYTAPPTAAPLDKDEIAPSDVFISFAEDGLWDEQIQFQALKDVTDMGPNDAGDGWVFEVVASGDPNAQGNLIGTDTMVDAEEYPCLQIKVKRADKTPLSGMIYYTTTNSPNLSEDQTATIRYKDTTDWQIINIDLNEKKLGYCTGNYTIIRFDMFNSTNIDSDWEIAYMAFFKSVDAANQYIENGGNFSELSGGDSENDATPAPATQATATTAPATTAPATTGTASKAPATGTSAPSDDSDSGNTTLIIIIVVVVIAAAAIAVAVILIMKKKKAGK